MQAGSWMGDEPGEKEQPCGGLFNKVRPSTPHRENRAMGRRNMGEAATVQPLGTTATQLPSWDMDRCGGQGISGTIDT